MKKAKPLFVENLPIIGQVPMGKFKSFFYSQIFIVFFIPDTDLKNSNFDEKRKLQKVIEKYGGILSEFHECFTYQLEPISDPLTPKHYFEGDVYQSRWILDSAKEGVLLDKALYFVQNSKHENCKRLGFGKSSIKYTITEAIKIFTIGTSKENKIQAKSSSFWVDVARKNIIPKRSAESIREFWKKHEKKGL